MKVFHWAEDTKRAVPMFSVMFHTGFVADNVLHLDAEEVDGAKHNARFPPDFFVDCFFAEKAHAFVEEKGEIGGASGLANVDPDPEPPQEGKSVERRVSDEEAKTSIELAQTINEIEEILKDGAYGCSATCLCDCVTNSVFLVNSWRSGRRRCGFRSTRGKVCVTL